MRRQWFILAILPLVLVLAGCLPEPGQQATGQGVLPPDLLTGKATFAFKFTVTATSGQPIEGDLSGTYHDPGWRVGLRTVDVAFKGTGHFRRTRPPSRFPADTVCVSGPGSYQSLNKKQPGLGFLNLTMCDLGKPGPSAGDYLNVDVVTGPYTGYFKLATVQSGDIQIR